MTILERFEQDLAVLETDDGRKTLPRTQLPADAEVGDVLVLTAEGYTVDKTAAQKRRKKLSERFRRLIRR
ncbi:MAG: DUF3006 domain-containing protein [Ruminococcaceae bacterium]|nr:DUF3006 domain-containing protein [Oscillospiraceae bacterium]MBQ4047470.1 DUF3006 domain-containing protein [Clostridia bacterium]